ncbi:MAG: RNA polymerase sigma factor RpoD/SigA [Saprospiraceae bacterium]|jgi:RNA polymerase primary sigma factor|nr:RNA polymerase sigma factor RpoD/SigA [Saprospiraceae bacterium]
MRQLKIAHKITSRESYALERYLADISKIELLSPEQESDLAQRIRNDDEDALDKLVRANLRFVVSVAKQYQNQGLSLSDLINEGNVGLLKAAKRFDETKGFKFISYAVWWIRQSILQAIVEYSRIVRLPTNKVTQYNKVNNTFASFLQEFQREPSNEELSDLLNLSVKEVASLISSNSRHVSMDAPMSDDEESSTLLELISTDADMSPDLQLMEESVKMEIQYGMAFLSPRELDVIACFFGLNGFKEMSLEEIAEKYDLTKERVRQIKDRAINRLKRNFNKHALRSVFR